MPNGWCQWHAQLGFKHWVLVVPPLSQTVGFCDLLGTPYAPVSKLPSVKMYPREWEDRLFSHVSFVSIQEVEVL